MRNGAIPRDACWIDSPGISDTEEMNQRAREAADRSDVLLWVLSSRQPLAEAEVAFVSDHVQRNGATAVLFLLNLFLEPDDTPEAWARAQLRLVPYCRDKLEYLAGAMGLDGAANELLVVSGRAVNRHSSDQFGGRELRQTLHALSSTSHPRVQAARLHRAAHALEELADGLQQEVRRERERIDADIREIARRKAETDKARRQFDRLVRSAVNAFYKEWATAAARQGERVAASIQSGSLSRDGSYGTALTAAPRTEARARVTHLAQTIDQHAAALGQRGLGQEGTTKLAAVLRPRDITVTVPPISSNADTGAGIGAAIGGVLDFIFGAGPPGAALGAALGGAAGAGLGQLGQAADRETAAQTARNNVEAGARQAVVALRARREEAISRVLDHCTSSSVLPSQPSDWPLRAHEGLLRQFRSLADEAQRLGRVGLR